MRGGSTLNKLIVIPGSMDGVFFLNEIEWIKSMFSEVVVLTYPGDKEKFERLSQEHQIKYHVVPQFSLRSIFKISSLKLIFSKFVRTEISNILKSKKKVGLRLAYMLHYLLFGINGMEYIDAEVKENNGTKICLYSFWLSRGAFLIGLFNIHRDSNVRLILSRAHGYDLYEERNKSNYLPFRNFIFENLDEIHFISKDGQDYFNSKYTESIKGSVTRLGTRNDVGMKIIVSKNYLTIASCSSINKNKRLYLIINVLSEMQVPFHWIHIGTGEDEEMIKNYACKKLKKENYEFLGKVNNDQILDIYLNNDVDYFINMSDSEGVPVSIMEAISLGIPIISRNVGGIKEIVSSKNGLLLSSNLDEIEIYKSINNFVYKRFYDFQYYKSLSDTCIKVWETSYNADNNYYNFFNSILNKIDN